MILKGFRGRNGYTFEHKGFKIFPHLAGGLVSAFPDTDLFRDIEEHGLARHGVWVSPYYKCLVIRHPDKDCPRKGRAVAVFDPKSVIFPIFHEWPAMVPGAYYQRTTDSLESAREYFKEHPEDYSPWRYAQKDEAWDVTVKGETFRAIVIEDGKERLFKGAKTISIHDIGIEEAEKVEKVETGF